MRLAILVTLLLRFLPTAVPAQFAWEAFGPKGGNFIALMTDANQTERMIAVTENALNLVKTGDGGSRWDFLPRPYPMNAAAGSSDLNHLYLAAHDIVQHSVDGGLTWTVYDEIFYDRYLIGLSVHPTQPLTVYAAAYDTTGWYFPRFLKTTDGGQTWAQNVVLPEEFVSMGLGVSPFDGDLLYLAGSVLMYDEQWNSSQVGFVFRSKDGGLTWEDLGQGIQSSEDQQLLAVAVGAASAVSEHSVYVTGSHTYRSNDSGQSWTRCPNHVTGSAVAASPDGKGYVCVAGNGRVHISSDYGATWRTYENAIVGRATQVSILGSSPLHIRVATADGLFETQGIEDNWRVLHGDLRLFQTGSIAATESPTPTMAVSCFGSDLFVSTDGGTTWDVRTPGNNDYWYYGSIVATNDALVTSNSRIVDSGVADYNFRSVNGGLTWTGLNSGFYPPRIVQHPAESERLYLLDDDRMRRSLDGGETWLPEQQTNLSSVRAFAAAPTDPDLLYLERSEFYADGWRREIFRSLDGGDSWDLRSSSKLPTATALLVDVRNPKYLLAARSDYLPSNRLLVSRDGGLTWEATSFTGGTIIALIHGGKPDILYAATTDKGVFYSVNRGQRWSPLSVDQEQMECVSLNYEKQTDVLYLGTRSNGTYRLRDATRVIDASSADEWQQYE